MRKTLVEGLVLCVLLIKGSTGLSMPVLYCKPSSRDPSKVGDCPFCHFTRFCLEISEKEYTLKPTTKDQKPQWLLDLGGSMPCFVEDEDGKNAMTESAVISASILAATEEDEVSLQVAKPLFPAIAKFIKIDNDPKLEQSLLDVLDSLEKRLIELLGDKEAKSVYFSGSSTRLGLSDASIATKLFVLDVAGKHFKHFTLPSDSFPHLLGYMDSIFQRPEFLRTKYDEADMLIGWTEARAGAH